MVQVVVEVVVPAVLVVHLNPLQVLEEALVVLDHKHGLEIQQIELAVEQELQQVVHKDLVVQVVEDQVVHMVVQIQVVQQEMVQLIQVVVEDQVIPQVHLIEVVMVDQEL